MLMTLSFLSLCFMVSTVCGENIIFYELYNRDTINSPEILTTLNISSSKNFDRKTETKFIIHGYNSGCNEDVNVNNKNAYLKKHDVNVFCVNWESMTRSDPITAVLGIPQVVGNLTDMIIKLNIPPCHIHILGHSFGAHIAGSTAEQLLEAGYGKMSRITGLDPAALFLSIDFNKTRLSRDSAEVVDVIHTETKFFGTSEAIGHFDFYPNGAANQPGCTGPSELPCSHSRSHELFAESILNPKAFPALRCHTVNEALSHNCAEPSTVYMGNLASYKLPGIYYVATTAGSKFATKTDHENNVIAIMQDTEPDISETLAETIRLHALGITLFLRQFF